MKDVIISLDMVTLGVEAQLSLPVLLPITAISVLQCSFCNFYCKITNCYTYYGYWSSGKEDHWKKYFYDL